MFTPNVMKTLRHFNLSARSFASGFHRNVLTGLLLVAWWLPGHAAEQPARITRSGRPASEAVWAEPGAVVISSPATPAVIGFDRGQGQIESSKDRAQEFARASLEMAWTPDEIIQSYPHPFYISAFGLEYLAEGTARFAWSPVAALVGAASGGTVDAATFSRVEQKLQSSLEVMAQQEHLRDALLKSASRQTHRRFLPQSALLDAPSNGIPVSAVLGVRLEELRLDQIDRGDESFVLRIKARVQVARGSDGKVLYDEPFEYQSGSGLFLDWSLEAAIKNVAETGYRKLADCITDRLFLATRDEPTLIGAGAGKSRSIHPAVVVRQEVAALPAASAGLMPVVNRIADQSTFGIYATSSVPQLVIRAPLTKNKAVQEARSDIKDGHLGELIRFPNPVVSLLALGAAIPVGIYKQASASINGLTEAELISADQKVRVAINQSRAHEAIALVVADQLTRHTSQTVVLISPQQATGYPSERGLIQAVARDSQMSQRMTKAMVIHVTRAVLKGDGGANPPLALHLEATATVLRTSDGQVLYECPVSYVGRGRKYVEWSNQEAKLLREEMASCYHELGRTIVTQLITRKVLPPTVIIESMLAATDSSTK